MADLEERQVQERLERIAHRIEKLVATWRVDQRYEAGIGSRQLIRQIVTDFIDVAAYRVYEYAQMQGGMNTPNTPE